MDRHFKLGRVSHRNMDTLLLGAGYDEMLAAELRKQPNDNATICRWCGDPCKPSEILCDTCKMFVSCSAEMPATTSHQEMQ